MWVFAYKRSNVEFERVRRRAMGVDESWWHWRMLKGWLRGFESFICEAMRRLIHQSLDSVQVIKWILWRRSIQQDLSLFSTWLSPVPNTPSCLSLLFSLTRSVFLSPLTFTKPSSHPPYYPLWPSIHRFPLEPTLRPLRWTMKTLGKGDE